MVLASWRCTRRVIDESAPRSASAERPSHVQNFSALLFCQGAGCLGEGTERQKKCVLFRFSWVIAWGEWLRIAWLVIGRLSLGWLGAMVSVGIVVVWVRGLRAPVRQHDFKRGNIASNPTAA